MKKLQAKQSTYWEHRLALKNKPAPAQPATPKASQVPAQHMKKNEIGDIVQWVAENHEKLKTLLRKPAPAQAQRLANALKAGRLAIGRLEGDSPAYRLATEALAQWEGSK